tara:strand:- start:3154 stop:3387 length:234 start_codon:yes stop_codon:yes gene_type:complete
MTTNARAGLGRCTDAAAQKNSSLTYWPLKRWVVIQRSFRENCCFLSDDDDDDDDDDDEPAWLLFLDSEEQKRRFVTL